MLQLGGELDLPAEPLHIDGGGQLGEEHLHHDLSAEDAVERDEDAGHPAAAELALQEIGFSQRPL